jgi:pyruvate kinase
MFARVDEAIAMAAMYTANHLAVKAIAALTESGLLCCGCRASAPAVPIYALTGKVETRRKVSLYRGVYPIVFDRNNVGSRDG